MEFDIGTLFYILITIIAIVAGVLGQKKKPADGQPASGEDSGPFSFFSKLEEQIEGMVEEKDYNVQEPVEEGVAETGQRDENRIYQEEGSYDWTAEESDFDSKGSSYNQFEGVYDPGKEAGLDSIIAEAERSTSDDEIEVIEVEDISYPDYFQVVEDFDLGTAVIYSAIINRKEY